MRRDRTYLDYLRDILNATEAALSFVEGVDFAEFSASRRTNFAVVRALEIIGEAANHVPDEVRDQWPQVAWQDMRNVLIHAYFGVDLETVRRTV